MVLMTPMLHVRQSVRHQLELNAGAGVVDKNVT